MKILFYDFGNIPQVGAKSGAESLFILIVCVILHQVWYKGLIENQTRLHVLDKKNIAFEAISRSFRAGKQTILEHW